jgi:thymidylate synthase
MNNLDKDYQNLLQDIIDNGIKKNDRTSTGTYSVFGRQLRHSMDSGFPVLTTKKIAFKSMVTELLWFLRGDTSLRYLLDNNCTIWVGDCYNLYLNKTKVLLTDKIWAGPSIENFFSSIEFDDNNILSITSFIQEEFIEKIKTDDDFNNRFGNLGPIYGKQWRDWFYGSWWYNGSRPMEIEKHIDQIQVLIDTLKTNPDSRRMIVSAWNVGELDQCVLPPCHYTFQVWTRELTLEERYNLLIKLKPVLSAETIEDLNSDLHAIEILDWYKIPKRKISLMFNMRSWDVFLGGPFNIASYGLLLTILGKMANMVPDELIVSSADTHLYSNHIEQAKEQISRTPFELPQVEFAEHVNFNGTIDDFLNTCNINDIKLINYQSHNTIKAPLSN